MDYTTHLIVHPYPVADDTFETKLKDVSDQICTHGYTQPAVLANMTNVVEAVVSNSHLAFLLDDGRICRISYNLSSNNEHTSNTTTTTTSASSNAHHCDTIKIQKTKMQNTNTQSTTSTSTTNSLTATIAAAAAAAAAVAAASSTNTDTPSQQQQQQQQQFRPQSRATFRSHETFIIPAPQEILQPISTHTFSRGRRQLLRGRVSSLIMGSRMQPIVPASAVPEALIESVQTVLQSKSRNVIIRELQRTNLDVNLAVNNLLQRDDEGDEAGDDDDPYIHAGDDLISLLDINSHGDHSVIIDSDGSVFDEDTFRISRRIGRSIAASGGTATGAASTNPTEITDRDRKSYRIRDQRWYDSAYRDEMFASRDNNNSSSSSSRPDDLSSTHKKSQSGSNNNNSSQQQAPVVFGESLVYWTDRSGDTPKFAKIATLYSELIGVTTTGKLYQWKWTADKPYHYHHTSADPIDIMQHHHPKANFLNLSTNERVIGIATSIIRASIWTESGKIATWLDDTIDIGQTVKFQTSLQTLYDPTTDAIQQLSVSNMFSVARMASGTIYWWGLMPFDHRAKLVDKFQSKTHKMKIMQSNEICVGSYVCLKTLPLYNSGTIAFTVKDGQPRLGQITEHLFSLRDTKTGKFRIRTAESFRCDATKDDSHAPPMDHGTSNSMTTSQYDTTTGNPLKRKKPPTNSDTHALDGNNKPTPSPIKPEESWPISESIFVDDTRAFLLGKVIKIDSDYVIVKMQSKFANPNDPSSSTMTTTTTTTTTSDNVTNEALLDNCRVFQKNQLQAIKGASSLKLPDFIQKVPKKLVLNGLGNNSGQLLTFVAQQTGIHAVIEKDNSFYYVLYDIVLNKIIKEKRFTSRVPNQMTTNGNCMSQMMRLHTIDDPGFNLLTLIDANSTLYPVIDVPGSNTIRDPVWKNLFPLKYFSQCIIPTQQHTGTTTRPSANRKAFVSLFSMRIELLSTHILRYDIDRVQQVLAQIDTNEGLLKRILAERCDGNRNIIHAAVYACAPLSNKDNETTASGFSIPLKTLDRSWSSSSGGGGTTTTATANGPPSGAGTTKDPFRKVHSMDAPSSSSSIDDHTYGTSGVQGGTSRSTEIMALWLDEQSGAPQTIAENKKDSTVVTVWPRNKVDDKERKQNAICVLQLLLDSIKLKENRGNNSNNNSLAELLAYKNADGATPFMYAINIRAYNAALCIFDAALAYKKDNGQLFNRILFAANDATSPVIDYSPLYVLCCNDTCSFTWTGDNHITQDIFECRTCTLVGNLCCCTECARTCHKGHDCKIKTSSPTAYCDCWEKCKCKSLIAGDQEKRYELLCKLLTHTDLLQMHNTTRRNEHLLLFLVQTVGRQIHEQRNYKRASTNTMLRKNLTIVDGCIEMPQHDLEPPRFSRRALERILNDWQAIKDLVLYNYNTGTNQGDDDDLHNQSSSSDLDKFTYFLVVKCPQEVLDTLLNTIHKELVVVNQQQQQQNTNVAKRFIRSVIRLYVILNVDASTTGATTTTTSSTSTTSGGNMLKFRKATFSSSSSSNNASSHATISPIAKCELVFKRFVSLSVEELVVTASSLVSPLLVGTSKPTMYRPVHQHQTTQYEERHADRHPNYVIIDELFNVESIMQRSVMHNNTTSATQAATVAQTTTSGGAQQTASFNVPVSQGLAAGVRVRARNADSVAMMAMDDDQVSELVSDDSEATTNTRDNYVINEDPMDLNLFAESDSDNTTSSNNSNRDNASAAQRSAITAATVGTGSDLGAAYFSDNDSDVTSNDDEDDDDEDDDEDDDDDNDDDDDDEDMRSDILNVDNTNETTSEMAHNQTEQVNTGAVATTTTTNASTTIIPLTQQSTANIQTSTANDLYNRQIQWNMRRHQDQLQTRLNSATMSSGATTSSTANPTSVTSGGTSTSATGATTGNSTSLNFSHQTSNAGSLYQELQHMRRATSAIPMSTLAQQAHHHHHHQQQHTSQLVQQQQQQHQQQPNESTLATNNNLARLFAVIIKQIRDLMNTSYQQQQNIRDLVALVDIVNPQLDRIWTWFACIMDSVEAQLRFACSASQIESSVAVYLKTLEDKARVSNEQQSSPTGTVNNSSRRGLTASLSQPVGLSTAAASSSATIGIGHQQMGSMSTSLSGLRTLYGTHSSGNASTAANNELANTARRDFMNYALSLMRMGSNEHKDVLPVIDIAQFKYIAYIFDGLMYYLRLQPDDTTTTEQQQQQEDATSPRHQSATLINMTSLYETDEVESEGEIDAYMPYQVDLTSDQDDDVQSKTNKEPMVATASVITRVNTFFQRSESTLCLGGTPPDPFAYGVDEALPLATKPHLLQQNSRKQDLFKNKSDHMHGLLNRHASAPKLAVPAFKRKAEMNASASGCLKAIVHNIQKSLKSIDTAMSGEQQQQQTGHHDHLLDLSLNKSPSTSASSSPTVGSSPSKLPGTSTCNKATAKDQPIYNIPSTTTGQTDELFDRWRTTLDLFGRIFCDDVGLEHGSVIRQLGGFQIKETRFRREMEKYRNTASKELVIDVERDRDLLLQLTFKTLNSAFSKRSMASSSSSSTLPPLCVSRVKVTFKDEQGEGSGVARSFYTAFCEAILENERIPSLEHTVCVAMSPSSSMAQTSSMVSAMQAQSQLSFNMLQRYRSTRDYNKRRQRSKSRDTSATLLSPEQQQQQGNKLCVNSQPFYIPGPHTPPAPNAEYTLYESLSPSYKEIGEKLFFKVSMLQPLNAAKITGMLLDLKIQQLTVLLNSDNFLKAKIDEAVSLLATSSSDVIGGQTRRPDDLDNVPLFCQADRKGFYSPRPGKNSTLRLNAYRNIGRIVGICLLQNELCPLPLARHVIKYVLNRPIRWHDLAFYDSVAYESLRKMIAETERNGEQACKAYDLTFNIDLPKDEDCVNYDLIPNGSNIQVNKANMYDYVKRYTEFRLCKRIEQSCLQIKLGIYDVLPANALNGLNAEDFRLLLNGINDINVHTLMGYTKISDESNCSVKRAQFEKWFWHTIEKMSSEEKQELLFFWTGSPYLPASEEGFQPLPSITIRPASDQHLPTANTCINRLYLPLYSSKHILKSKLLYAIKTKLFGFV